MDTKTQKPICKIRKPHLGEPVSRMGLVLPKAVVRKIDALAARRGLSRSALIRIYIDKGLALEPPRAVIPAT